MEKIKIKGIILVLLLVSGILGLNSKYQKYRNEKNNEKLLKENKKELEVKIENAISEKEEHRKEIQSDYEQI